MTRHEPALSSRSEQHDLTRARQEALLVQSWKDQQLSVHVARHTPNGESFWMRGQVRQVYRSEHHDGSESPFVVEVLSSSENGADPVVENFSVKDFLETQDRYFVDRAFDTRVAQVKPLENAILGEAQSLALNYERVSHPPSYEEPPEPEELKDVVERIAEEYTALFLAFNERASHLPSEPIHIPSELIALYFGAHGRRVTHDTVEASSFDHWRREDFEEAYKKALSFLETFPLGILLEELMRYGIEPRGLPQAVSSANLKEFLFFLQRTIVQGREAYLGRVTPNMDLKKQALLDQHRAQVDMWRAAHLPLSIRQDADTWVEGQLTASNELRNDPRDPSEKGVQISYAPSSDPEAAPIKKFIRLSQLVAFQERHLLDTLRAKIEEAGIHPWLPLQAHVPEEIFTRVLTCASPDFPPSLQEKTAFVRAILRGYRDAIYQEQGLRPAREEASSTIDPAIIPHLSAWARGRAAAREEVATSFLDRYRELHQPFWRDQDYADLLPVLQKELRRINLGVLREKMVRFGTSSIDLPPATTPQAFAQALDLLEQAIL